MIRQLCQARIRHNDGLGVSAVQLLQIAPLFTFKLIFNQELVQLSSSGKLAQGCPNKPEVSLSNTVLSIPIRRDKVALAI
jgi:hypothetical protein